MLRAEDIGIGRRRISVNKLAFLDDIHLALDAHRQIIRVSSIGFIGCLLIIQDHAQGLRATLILTDKIHVGRQPVRQSADRYANFTAYLRDGRRYRAGDDSTDVTLGHVNQVIEAREIEGIAVRCTLAVKDATLKDIQLVGCFIFSVKKINKATDFQV